MDYLSKNGGVFSGVSERVNVPGHPGTPALAKGVIQESQPQSHLIYDSAVVSGGLIAHAPAAVYELKTTYEKRKWNIFFLLWIKYFLEKIQGVRKVF